MRSGTTLARVILDSHPQIACGPESQLFCGRFEEYALSRKFEIGRGAIRRMERTSPSFPEFVTRFLVAHAERDHAEFWAEKTPGNIHHVGWILERFPDATFSTHRQGRSRRRELDSGHGHATASSAASWCRTGHDATWTTPSGCGSAPSRRGSTSRVTHVSWRCGTRISFEIPRRRSHRSSRVSGWTGIPRWLVLMKRDRRRAIRGSSRRTSRPPGRSTRAPRPSGRLSSHRKRSDGSRSAARAIQDRFGYPPDRVSTTEAR